MQRRFGIDIVIKKYAIVFELLARINQTLFGWRDSAFFKDFFFDCRNQENESKAFAVAQQEEELTQLNRIAQVHIQCYGFTSERLDKNLRMKQIIVCEQTVWTVEPSRQVSCTNDKFLVASQQQCLGGTVLY